MFVYFYYLIMYFFTVIFGLEVSDWALPLLSKFMDSDSIGAFLSILVASSILSAIFSFLLHFIYIWKSDSDRFLKPFYRVHFFATYISGAFSIINIGEKTLTEWEFKNISVDSTIKVACLILLFVALSNNAFYKTFEKEIVNMLQSIVKKIKAK
ncbi:TPA: hypothetical protein ROX98_003117 [Bacillus pseudomycoides]|nr:hypothetical protein [Bacillus pseudomycoides]